MRSYFRRAFTLIELLIVVAIIAILAAIAVPNFLEAQVRAKVARVASDLRSIATCLESYTVDTNKRPLMRYGQNQTLYGILRVPEDVISPPGNPPRSFNQATLPLEITTPISYCTTTLNDPFKSTETVRTNVAGTVTDPNIVITTDPTTKDYRYDNIADMTRLSGAGFDDRDLAAYGGWRLVSTGPDKIFVGSIGRSIYDPTNGTISRGDIIRTERSSAGLTAEGSTSGSN